MNLKDFKAGVEFLARATNQRQAEPAPFLVQVGKDGRVSLVAGEGVASYIWRTGFISEWGATKFGISSKLLVQTTKTLKGKDMEIELHVDDAGMVVLTNKKGKVRLPPIEEPDIRPPKFGAPEARLEFPERRLEELVKAIAATAEGGTSRGVQFMGDYRQLMMVATEEHKAFVTYFHKPDMDEKIREGKWGTTAAFWNPLRDCQSHAALTLFQTGLHIRSGDFEAYSGFSILPVYDIRQTYFPEGVRPPIYVVTDRKVLLGSIKSLTGDERNGTINMEQNSQGFRLFSGKEEVGMPRAKGKGYGKVGFSPEYMSDILNAMSGKEVILAWHTDANKPIGIKDASRQGDTFILAPRSQA